MPQKIISTIKNNIGFITLNNPSKSNALDIEMRAQLIRTYRDFEKNPDVRIIMLNGNGKHFCAGANLNHMKQMTIVSYAENLQDAKKFSELFYTVYACEKPTLCVAQGKIIGGGLGLLAASDIAIATHDATFCFSEVKLGLLPATISPIVMRRIGYQSSKYFMMTARLFDAPKALKIGLIDHIGDDALSIAESMLRNSQAAMQTTKKWLSELYHPVTKKQMEQAATWLATMRNNVDTKLAIQDFLSRK